MATEKNGLHGELARIYKIFLILSLYKYFLTHAQNIIILMDF